MTRPLARLARRLPPVLLSEPWAVWVALGSVASGLAYLLGFTPGSVRSALPLGSVLLWNVSLAGGGALVLAGILRRRLSWEAAGLWPLGTAALVYATTLVMVLGARGAVTAMLVATFGGAAYMRLLAIYTVKAVYREQLHRRGLDAS